MAKGKVVGKIIANAGADGGFSAVSGALNKVKSTGRRYVDAMMYDTQNVGPRMAKTLERETKMLSHEIGKAKKDGLSDTYIKGMQNKHARLNASRKNLEGASNIDDVADRLLETQRMFNGEGTLEGVKGSLAVGGRLAKDYFWDSANKTQKAARIGTVAGMAGASALGGRYMSGGNAMYNSKGERDIVGVPFM